jgi:nucleoside 2-deoxyribosyltransferase
MRLYISGRITVNPNYKEEFDNAEKWLKERDITPINPCKVNAICETLSYEEFMKIDYALIDLCDGLFMLKGWQESKGALSEMCYAKSLGKKIHYQGYFERRNK